MAACRNIKHDSWKRIEETEWEEEVKRPLTHWPCWDTFSIASKVHPHAVIHASAYSKDNKTLQPICKWKQREGTRANSPQTEVPTLADARRYHGTAKFCQNCLFLAPAGLRIAVWRAWLDEDPKIEQTRTEHVYKRMGPNGQVIGKVVLIPGAAPTSHDWKTLASE